MSPRQTGFETPEVQALLALSDGGAVIHDRTGAVVSCDRGAERLLRAGEHELAGRSSLLAHARARDEFGLPWLVEREPAREALRDRRPAGPVICRVSGDDGEPRWLELRAAPLYDGTRLEPTGALTHVRDVSTQRALEARTRGRHRLEALGRLASSVAHDFNNLLTVILGYNGFLLDSLPPSDPRWLEADEVRKAAQRGANLTRQLLAFSRGQVIEVGVLDLNQVLIETEPMLRRMVGRSVRLQLQTRPGVAAVRADRGQLEQVIMNLVLNARDAMPEGGNLVVSTDVVELDATFVSGHVGSRRGRHVVLQVSDDGCGMDADTQQRIFEPFFTTKSDGRGTGLGLSTVYGIVKQHGGYIGVESTAGQGTTFRLYLPGTRATPRVSVRLPAAEPAPGHSETILLAIEDEQVRRLARRVLRRNRYHVLEESDGARAAELAERHGGPIDVLVADAELPGLDGVSLSRRCASQRPDIGVLFLSGDAALQSVDGEPPLQHVRVLPKPFRPSALLERLFEVLSARRGGRSPDVTG